MKTFTVAVLLVCAPCFATEPSVLRHWMTQDGVTKWEVVLDKQSVDDMVTLSKAAKDPEGTMHEMLKNAVGGKLSEARLCAAGWEFASTANSSFLTKLDTGQLSVAGYCRQ